MTTNNSSSLLNDSIQNLLMISSLELSRQSQVIGACYLISGLSFLVANIFCAIPLVLSKQIRSSPFQLIVLHIAIAGFFELLVIGVAAGVFTLSNVEVI